MKPFAAVQAILKYDSIKKTSEIIGSCFRLWGEVWGSDLIINFKRNGGILEIALSEFQIVNFKDATSSLFTVARL
jgi:hypothetical protein